MDLCKYIRVADAIITVMTGLPAGWRIVCSPSKSGHCDTPIMNIQYSPCISDRSVWKKAHIREGLFSTEGGVSFIQALFLWHGTHCTCHTTTLNAILYHICGRYVYKQNQYIHDNTESRQQKLTALSHLPTVKIIFVLSTA